MSDLKVRSSEPCVLVKDVDVFGVGLMFVFLSRSSFWFGVFGCV